MFGPDPIDFFDPSPYGAIAFYGHIFIGLLALSAALLAFTSRKGGALHRRAGLVYIGACAVVCATSAAMLAIGFIPPLMLAVFTAIYAIGGAYLALQQGTPTVRLAEKGLFLFELAGLTIFLSIAMPEVAKGTIPIFAPVVIAAIPLMLIIGDLNWFARHGERRKLRIARHMARMIWAFIVVLRAPLVELAAGGILPAFQALYIVGPIILGVVMLWYFQRKYGGSPFGKTA